MSRLQNIHDHSVDMGAKCAGDAGKALDSTTLAKALGMKTDASESDLAKALSVVVEQAGKWKALPALKGPFRTFERGTEFSHTDETKDEVPADVAQLVRDARAGNLQAHMRLVHKGLADWRTRPEFKKIT
jgi:hypothetical protein